MPYNANIKPIQDGEPITEKVANRSAKILETELSRLWNIVDAIEDGTGIYARSVTIESDCLIGMAVYFNKTTVQFERALAEFDPTTYGLVETSERTRVWGIVTAKQNATTGDVLLYGYANVDLTAAVDGDVTAGSYYLSAITPGKLLKLKPSISTFVLQADGQGGVLVRPEHIDMLDRHVHYKFTITCLPAGTVSPPAPDDRHTITDADEALPGWLPADHESFSGTAPAGAVFGYNLAADTKLDAIWPPLPLSSAYLEWFKGLSIDVGFTGVPLGASGLCVLDKNGIWWMSNCYGDVPWPVDYDNTTSDSVSDSESASVSVECPRTMQMQMNLWLSRIQFASDSAVVRSLVSKDPKIIVRCADGAPGAAGDLAILLNLSLSTTNDVTGYLVLKNYNPETGVFDRGPAVEGVYTTSTDLTIESSTTAQRTIDGTERTVHHGLVGLTVSPTELLQLPVQWIRVNSSQAEYYEDTSYIGFPVDKTTSIRCVVVIPANTTIVSPELSLRFWLLGTVAGAMPQLTITARRISRPTDGTITPADLPTSDDEFEVICDTTATLTDTYQYVEAESDPFEVEAGDMVFFTVERSADDAYTGGVGILYQVGILQSAT